MNYLDHGKSLLCGGLFDDVQVTQRNQNVTVIVYFDYLRFHTFEDLLKNH